MLHARRSHSGVQVTAVSLVACLACVVVQLFGVGSARGAGSIGVGIQAAPITLATAAEPGHSYHFPAVYVINNGEQPITARFIVEPLNKGAQHVLPASWISFPTHAVPLQPGASAHVPITLQVPRSAALGTYLSDVVVHAVSAGAPSGVGGQVSAAAATKVALTVSSKAHPSRGGIPKWVLPAAIALAVALVLLLLWRSGIRITLTNAS
jgi:hypothetical protein